MERNETELNLLGTTSGNIHLKRYRQERQKSGKQNRRNQKNISHTESRSPYYEKIMQIIKKYNLKRNDLILKKIKKMYERIIQTKKLKAISNLAKKRERTHLKNSQAIYAHSIRKVPGTFCHSAKKRETTRLHPKTAVPFAK
ncbi:unnamed protein product [Clavelina lepadiformis]|uniref:Ribosomal protein S20 n=1 Tax=Clavelina lepadiformis TaxID=159417 RepID=A0ABP0G0U0_CLALP